VPLALDPALDAAAAQALATFEESVARILAGAILAELAKDAEESE